MTTTRRELFRRGWLGIAAVAVRLPTRNVISHGHGSFSLQDIRDVIAQMTCVAPRPDDQYMTFIHPGNYPMLDINNDEIDMAYAFVVHPELIEDADES